AIHDYRAMREDALALSEGVIANLQQRIETEVDAFLRPINGITTLSRDLLQDRFDAGIPAAEVDALGLGVLRNSPQLTALFAGDRNGEFVMVRREHRDGRDGLETKWIHRSERAPEGFEIAYTWHDEQGRVLSREDAPWDRYDPRTRPWYPDADGERGLRWTEAYPFFSDRAAGITASVPVIDADGALAAAIGADVTLRSIS